MKKGVILLFEVGVGLYLGYLDKEYEEVGVIVIDDVNVVLLIVDMFVVVNKFFDV